MDSERRSLVARIWASGTLQTAAPDLTGLVGLACIGVGVYQFSHQATWIYAGVVLVVLTVLTERARPRKGSRE